MPSPLSPPIDPGLRDRVVVVLVRARNPNNIGAVARAMYDFGFAHLRVVTDFPVPLETARSAVDASAILAGAGEFTALADALADCTLVLGTTAIGERALEHPVRALRDAVPEVAEHLAQAKGHCVALLFGSEKTGLSNEELSHCHQLLTIPMQQRAGVRHPSMNLGQAAAVCLYALSELDPLPGPPARERSAATGEELARLGERVTEVLERTGYTRRHPANASPEQIRRLLLRSGAPASDLPVWMGVLRQILWKLGTAPSTEGSPDR